MEAERPLLAVGDRNVPPTARIGQIPMGIRPSVRKSASELLHLVLVWRQIGVSTEALSADTMRPCRAKRLSIHVARCSL